MGLDLCLKPKSILSNVNSASERWGHLLSAYPIILGVLFLRVLPVVHQTEPDDKLIIRNSLLGIYILHNNKINEPNHSQFHGETKRPSLLNEYRQIKHKSNKYATSWATALHMYQRSEDFFPQFSLFFLLKTFFFFFFFFFQGFLGRLWVFPAIGLSWLSPNRPRPSPIPSLHSWLEPLQTLISQWHQQLQPTTDQPSPPHRPTNIYPHQRTCVRLLSRLRLVNNIKAH